MSGHKITRIRITDYLGIEALDVSPGPSGAVAMGRNGSGKTSFLKALRAALAASGVGPDSIRKGAEEAEILVDLDNLSVRRRITPKGNTLSVTQGEEFSVKAPQTYLTNLLGTSPLDPMDLLLLKPKERRQKILQALPVKLTIEKLREWWPKCPDNFDVSGHGLEVLETLRGKVYDKRAGANKAAKEARAEATRLAAVEADASRDAPSGPVDVEGAEKAYDTAKANVAALRARKEEAEKSEARTQSARDKAKALFDEGNRILLDLPKEIGASWLAQRKEELQAQQVRIDELREELRRAEEHLCFLRLGLKAAEQDNQIRAERISQAASLQDQASDLESAIALAVEHVHPADLDAAVAAEVEASTKLKWAKAEQASADVATKAKEAAAAAKAAAIAAETEADRLDRFVKVLTEDAPKELLASCDGIPGLSLDGDTIKLDGVSLDTLCGAEQVRFAVEVAKRANAKTKILVVDKLEALDPVAYGEFIRAATADGWQLLASRVDAGELVIESIGLDCAVASDLETAKRLAEYVTRDEWERK